MSYTLNDIALIDFGIIPTRVPGSNLALEGAWDLPKRTGKTHHVWLDERGVEAYVDTEDIRMAGRTLVLHAVIRGSSETDAMNKAYVFQDYLTSLDTLVTLASDWGSWDVYVKEPVQMSYRGDGVLVVQVIMQEPMPDLSGGSEPDAYTLETVLAGEQIRNVNGIDGGTFASLGLRLIRLEDYLTRPETQAPAFTAYATEGYQLTPEGGRKMRLSFVLTADDFTAFQTALKDLYKLLTNPGMRYLTKDGDAVAEFFVVDGFKVRQIQVASTVTALVELPVIYERMDVVGIENPNELLDLDLVLLTDLDGETILDL